MKLAERMRDLTARERTRGFDYARDHVTVGPAGTQAWFVLGGAEWATLSVAARSMLLDKQLAVWLDMVEFDEVTLRGTDTPYPVTDWVQAQSDEYPHPPNRAVRDGVLDGLRLAIPRLGATSPQDDRPLIGARNPVMFVGVTLTRWQVPRDVLHHVLADSPAPPPLGRVNEVRDTLQRVTDTMSVSGLDAAPVSSRALSWLDETSRLLGHRKPELSDATRILDAMPWMDEGNVEGEQYGRTARVVRMGVDGPEARHVAVRHVEDIEDRQDRSGRLDDGQSQDVPWLAWFLHREEPVELVAALRFYNGETVHDAAKNQRKIVRDTIDHWTKTNVDVEDSLLRGQAVADRAVAETARKPDEATRVWGRVMVAVSAGSEHDAIEAARVLTREARAEVGVELVPDEAVAEDVLRFRPGAVIPHTGHVRRMNARMLAAGAPGASWQAGSDVGILFGASSGSPSVTVWDPFEGVKTDQPGLWGILGTSGVGKTTTAELVAFWNLINGIPGTFFDPSGLVRDLVKMPELEGLIAEYPLTAGRPGLLMPSRLVLEPDRFLYDDEREFRDAVRAAKSERVNLHVDAALMHLPWSMVTDHTLGVQACAERAAARVGGDYGTHSRELIDAIRGDGSSVGVMIADQLEAVSQGFGALVFPDRDIDDATLDRFGLDTLGAVVTMPGIKMPDQADRYGWTQEQRQATVIASLGARLAARSIWADRSMKWMIADEAGISTVGVSSWGPFMLRGAYDARKFGCSFGVLGQTPSIFHRIESNIASLVGSVHVGRLQRDDAKGALPLLGLGQDSEWLDVFPTLPRGQFVSKHWPTLEAGQMVGKVRRGVVDLGPWPESLRKAVHNRPADRVGRVPDRLRGGSA